MKSLTIRVSDEEHALMQAAAAKRFMTITGMVRAHFHSIFEADGTLPDQQPTTPEPSKPAIERRPIPSSGNVWAYDVHARRTAGESFADIAASYGVDVAVIKRRYKFAEEEMEAGQKTPAVLERTHTTQPEPEPEPELIYDPVDPENPTEEEQAINAEIARRKLEAMGFTL